MNTVLTDENIHADVAAAIDSELPPNWRCIHIEELGLAGSKNGALVETAHARGIAVLVSRDFAMVRTVRPLLPIIVVPARGSTMPHFRNHITNIVAVSTNDGLTAAYHVLPVDPGADRAKALEGRMRRIRAEQASRWSRR